MEEDQEKQPRKQKELQHFALDEADNIIAVHIRHIREKIEIDPANPHYIVAVYGHGYKMERRDR